MSDVKPYAEKLPPVVAAAPVPAAAVPPPAPPQPAIALPKAPDGQMCLRVNGKDNFIDPKKYKTLIGALHDLGHDVPHFCYHPGLSPDGNCRMCYVNQIDVMSGKPVMAPNLAMQPLQMYPKPIISCREPLNPRGMVIETETPDVIKARKWVMEFLLINHPLDCPVCDKAGECMLQNNSFDHGNADSRFKEVKNEKAPKELGRMDDPHAIKLWTDRCITCTRCTRFLDEVSGTSELYIINRGDRSEIDIAPGHPVDNPMQGNIVDICPVGALIDTSLMFSYRAWYLQKTDSICPDCSKGCNIEVQAQKQYVRRLQPRENTSVNGWWMCDHGRHDFQYINDKTRVNFAKIDGAASLDISGAAKIAGEKLAAFAKRDANSVACLVSAWLTLEELHTIHTLFSETLGASLAGLLAQPLGKEENFPGFHIEADKNPNRAGAKLIFGAGVEAQTKNIIDGINSGKIKALFIGSGMPHYTPPKELVEALPKLELLIVQDLLNGPLTAAAHIVLPGSSFAEKDGVFVNSKARAQVLRRSIDPIAQGHDDLTTLQRMAKAAGNAESKLVSAREVFRRIAETRLEFAGMTHQSLGLKGAEVAKATPLA